jgi:glutamate 5-kinase
MKSRRIVVKVGSSSLTDSDGKISEAKMEHLVAQISNVMKRGWQVVVVSSGAVAAGLGKLGWQRSRITIPEKQAASAIGQGLLIDTYATMFERHGYLIGQLLLTRSDLEDRKRFLHIRNTLETMLRHRIVPIVNENDTVAVEEIRFGDNDTLSSLVALVAEAQLLVLLTDIDGLYTGNPRTDSHAVRIVDVWDITEDIERYAGGNGTEMGTGGMRTKLAAAKIATASGVDTIVAASTAPDVLERILDGESIGTRFHASKRRFNSKQSWLIFGGKAAGTLTIDAGAAYALQNHSCSLLLPGIVAVTGEFQEGAIVEVMTTEGETIAKGMVYYSATDLRLLLERKAHGESCSDLHEVIHRNQLVVLGRERKHGDIRNRRGVYKG